MTTQNEIVRTTIEPHRRAIVAHNAVVRSLMAMTTVEDVLRAVAAELCDLVGADRCSVYLKDEGTGIFRGQIGQAASSDIDAGVRRLIAGVEADRFTREIVETGLPVVVSDARIDPRPVRSTVRNWNIRSMLGVPLTNDREVIGLAFVDDERTAHRFTDADYEAAAAFGQLAGGAVAQALATVGARADLRAATRQNQLLRRAAALDERLTRLAVDGGGLSEILAVVAERTGTPVAALDESRRILAVAPASEAGAFLRAELDAHGATLLGVAVDDSGPTVVGPSPERGMHHRFLVAGVRARGTDLGHLVMAELGAPLSALDRHALRRAAAMVALERHAERRAVLAERDTLQSVVSDVLRGDRDPAWLTRRAAELGLDLDAPHVVCLIGGPVPEAPPSAAPTARALAAALGHDALPAAALAATMAVLVPAPAPGAPDGGRAAVAQLREAIAGALAPGTVIALSDPVRGVAGLHHAHGEAEQVLRALRTLGGDGTRRALCAHELGAGRLFLSSVDRGEADRFARHALGPLLAPDVGRELVDSLQAFFSCRRGLRPTAVALGVHENTIRYRFAKIRELTGLDVYGDADDQTTALLALRILQLTGVRPWDGA